MNAIPAKVAGVERLVVVVPTPDGAVNPLVLLATEIAGVDEAYRIGGAQAIAALAYGTDTIAPVDKSPVLEMLLWLRRSARCLIRSALI